MKPNKTPQQYIDDKVQAGEMITQCCVYGTIKGPDGDYFGYRFAKPYDNISHTYCPEVFETQMELLTKYNI